MRFTTAIRVYPAIWLAPVLVVLCIWYAHAFVYRMDPEPYLTGLSSQSVTTLGLIGPIVAGLAAWEAARLRRGGVWNFPAARRRLAVIAWPLGLVWVVGCAAIAAGVWAVILPKGFLVPDLRPVAVVALVLGAHSLAGFALGLLVPTVIVAPIAIAVSLLWQVVPRGIEPLWTHLLTSQQLETCCAPDNDIGPAALVAPALVALGIVAAAIVVIAGKRAALTALLASILVATGVTAGSVVASTQPRGDAYVARDERYLVCTQPSPQVCVWPEHVQRLAEVASIAREVASAWARPGLNVPDRFDEASTAPGMDGELHFVVYLSSSRDQMVSSMAHGMLPQFLDCEGGYEGYDAYDALNAWYASTGGMSARGLSEQFGGLLVGDGTDVLTLVEMVRGLPPSAQRDWVVRNTWALGACDRPAQLTPTSH